MISALQALLARTMLQMSQKDVAEALGWAHQTLSKIEKGDSNPPVSRVRELQSYYENAGVEFTDGDGVRRKQIYVKNLWGHEGFSEFLDDVYNTCINNGTVESPVPVYLSNVLHQNWIRWMGAEKWKNHTKRMTENKHLMDVRIIVRENDHNFPAQAYSQYKWFPETLFNDKSFYSYGDKLAFLNFKQDDVQVIILEQRDFAEGFRTLFQIAWDHVAQAPDFRQERV